MNHIRHKLLGKNKRLFYIKKLIYVKKKNDFGTNITMYNAYSSLNTKVEPNKKNIIVII